MKVNKTGTLNIKAHILHAYADDIDIVSIAERDVTDDDVIVNESKAKMMLATGKEHPRQRKGELVTAGNCNIEVVEEFACFGFIINQKNEISTEIEQRICAGK